MRQKETITCFETPPTALSVTATKCQHLNATRLDQWIVLPSFNLLRDGIDVSTTAAAGPSPGLFNDGAIVGVGSESSAEFNVVNP